MPRWPPYEVEDAGLWGFVVSELRYHRGNRPHEWIDTLNRLWRKNRFVTNLSGKRLIEGIPTLTTEAISVRSEDWPLERLGALLHPETHPRDEPLCDFCPMLVLEWKGRQFLIDGTTRINRRVRDKEASPHRVLVISVDSGI